MDEASNKEDDDDVVCEVCGDGEEMDGNSILLCDGSHSVTGGKSVGCHQLCCIPRLKEIPDGFAFHVVKHDPRAVPRLCPFIYNHHTHHNYQCCIPS